MPLKDKRKQREERVVNARRWADEQGKFDRPYIKIPTGIKQFRPEAGKEYTLDILPFIAGMGNPRADKGMPHWERSFRVHKNVGPAQKSYLCLEDHCPICAERKRLRSEGVDFKDPAMKATNVSDRQLFLIRLRGSKEIMLWDEANWNFGKYLKALLDRKRTKFGDKYDLFADATKGFSLEVGTKEEASGGGGKYVICPSVNFVERDKQPGDAIYDETPCLDDMLVSLTPKELEEVFFQTGGHDEETAERNGKHREKDEDDEDEKDTVDPDEDDDEDEDDDDDIELKPAKKSSRKPVDEDEDDEESEEDSDTEDEVDEDEDEKPAKKSKKEKTAKELGLKVGMMVEHPEHGECEITKISGDGTSITLQDDDGEFVRAVDPNELEILSTDKDSDDEDEDDEPEESSDLEEDADDDEPLEDEDDDEEDSDEDEKPAKKPAKKPQGKPAKPARRK